MAEPRIRLRVVGPKTKANWEGKRLLRIGRSDLFEVVLNDTSISRRHAEIEFTDQGWVARDLGSTNGTFLNGVRIAHIDRPLRERDLLQCGNVVLSVDAIDNDRFHYADTLSGNLQVQATAQHSLEQAAELLLMDATRSTRPGEQLLNLLRVGQNLDRLDSLDELLSQYLQATVTNLRARRGAVILIDEGTGQLALRLTHSTRAEPDRARSYSQTLATRCVRSGESLLCSDIQDDPELCGAGSVKGASMSSIICALLRSPTKNLGVLHLDRGLADPPFTRDDLHMADALAANMSIAIGSALRLQERQRDLFVQTLVAFSQAIEMRDEYTGGHTRRVTEYSLILADEMKLSGADRYHLRIGAPLHDIGKIGIDDAILRKRERLTAGEFEHMKSHTVKGAAILQAIPGLDQVIPIVRNHHERWDGLGYPDRMAGAAIPPLARLVAVADAFDAMTTNRPYRIGLSLDDAFAEIGRSAGRQFDPQCAEAFVRVQPRIEEILEQDESMIHTQSIDDLLDVRKLLSSTVCA